MIKIKRVDIRAIMPEYKTPGASGMDVHTIEDLMINPFSTVIARTGLQVAHVPLGYEIQVRPRSSLGAKGIIIPNSPGTIDNDYRGEIKIILHNLNDFAFAISKGDRIAQLVISQVCKMQTYETPTISESERGAGGFGSTGV